MKVILAFLILGIAAAAYEVLSSKQLGTVLENVGKRLQGEEVSALPEEEKQLEDELYDELKEQPAIVEEEQLAALMESESEYGWLKKKLKQIKKGAKKVVKTAVKGIIISKIAGAVG